MTYLGAAQEAQEAGTKARGAAARYNEVGDQLLAEAVSKLAEAVAELAETLHRES